MAAQILRALELWESIGFSQNWSACLQLRGSLNKETVQQAWLATQQDYPYLGMGVQFGDSPMPNFVRPPAPKAFVVHKESLHVSATERLKVRLCLGTARSLKVSAQQPCQLVCHASPTRLSQQAVLTVEVCK